MAKKILFAEDKEETARMIKKGLELAGYEVIQAIDGLDALEKIKARMPDLVILDVLMPKLDGFSVNLKLKEDMITKDIPVIISTSRVKMLQMFEKDGKAKIDAFLEKPYTLEELWMIIRKILKE
ncbi:MAG: hypothetical protein A2539_02765 [Elusimicrobia bacterium RIFOXYD2_FULL_34_15]|nr:MAG: hypothetical protein A2539_02765 [Elusimicrobia bacterium RIFOXYD2_FULL_34_15]